MILGLPSDKPATEEDLDETSITVIVTKCHLPSCSVKVLYSKIALLPFNALPFNTNLSFMFSKHGKEWVE